MLSAAGMKTAGGRLNNRPSQPEAAMAAKVIAKPPSIRYRCQSHMTAALRDPDGSRLVCLAITNITAFDGSQITSRRLSTANATPKSAGSSRWLSSDCIKNPRAPASRVLTPTIELCATNRSAESADQSPGRRFTATAVNMETRYGRLQTT
jgi:hypothetical protein